MTTIGILSAVTVFSMACVSLVNSVNVNVKINIQSSLMIAIGSIIGGVIGKLSFNYIVDVIAVSDVVTVIQAGIISVLMVMILVLVKNKGKVNFQLKNRFIILGIGFILGMIAAFLGIGGGPFNVAILALCFSMGAKEAALNSIFIIFFSQLSSLLFTFFSTGFTSFDLTMLPFMVIGGVLGGFLGSTLSNKVNDRYVQKVFYIGIIVIIVINIYNIMKYFI